MMKDPGLVTRILFAGLAATTAAIVACGAPPAASGTATTTSPAASESSATTITPAAASPAPVLSQSDVDAAVASALGIYKKLPLNASDAASGYVWISGPGSRDHLSDRVKTRLAELSSSAYFTDGPGGCGEDYLTGSQNGLFQEPQARSATAMADGTVEVVIARGSTPRDLTAVMMNSNGAWLASDLRSGTGPAASIFSAKPNC